MPAKKSYTENIKLYLNPIKRQISRLFRLSPKEREKVYNQINTNATDDFAFFLVTSFAAVIITLGLIINNGAVIIGGMLISPLLWPILSFSLAITRGRVYTVKKAFFVLLRVSFMILIMSSLVGLISPFNVYKEEVLSRTEPTLVELIIGLTAGFIGTYAVSSKKIASSIGGVAISVALVPPLCVAGLTLVSGDYQSAIGALLLYASNLMGIIVSSILVFIAEGYFTSTSTTGENIRRSYLAWSFVLLIIISLPLVTLTKSLVSEQQMKNFILQTFKTASPDVVVNDIKLDDSTEVINIELTVSAQEDIDVEIVDELSRLYSGKYKKPVLFSVNSIKFKKVTTTNFSP